MCLESSCPHRCTKKPSGLTTGMTQAETHMKIQPKESWHKHHDKQALKFNDRVPAGGVAADDKYQS